MTMTPERFAAIRALWADVVDLPVDARAAHLLRVAPDDADLRSQVMELIAAHHESDPLLDSRLVDNGLLGELAFTTDAARVSPLIDRMLGAYRVTHEIGQGGMGTVYAAERADDQFNKRVAIKTLRHDRGSAEVLERFSRERQIQAALAHPNIATLLDAGVTDEHVPYIVLEYVDGLPIDRYCEANRLTLTQRLDLFLQVVKAVQHAHRQLVVHRDLKPSNILVTENGIVKLLDFGISKLLDESLDHTVTEGPRAFTTAYASPEQIRGEPVSTASDVYSLGVVLYRLLSGTNPFNLEHATSRAAWVIICETEPVAPSTAVTADAATAMGVVSPMKLGAALKGELDAIVLMALRKEPDRRYATADAMGEDILNHLRGRPVQARPDSAGYRVRKFASRNRLASASLVVAFAAMAAGTAISLWQLREARQASGLAETQRALADQERRTAERVSGFLQGMFSAADRSWSGKSLGPNTTIAEVIDSAAVRVDRDLADEPAVAEALHHLLQSNYIALQQVEKGKHHSRRVLALMRARNATDVEIARGLHDLGALHFVGGARDSSLQVLRESYALFEKAGFPETEDFSLTLNQLGLTLWDAGRPAEAEPYLTRAVAVRQKVVGDDAAAAIMLSNLAQIREAQGDLTGAEQRFRAAEGIYASLGDRQYFEHGSNLNNLATLLLVRGAVAEADSLMRASLAVLEEVLGPQHVFIGLGTMNLARIQLAQGRPEEALTTLRRGAALIAPFPENHPNVAKKQTYEAAILLALGRTAEAEANARRALVTRERVYPAGDWRIAETQGVLGRIRLARGASDEGRQLLSASYASFRKAMGDGHPRTREIGEVLEGLAASASASDGRPEPG